MANPTSKKPWVPDHPARGAAGFWKGHDFRDPTRTAFGYCGKAGWVWKPTLTEAKAHREGAKVQKRTRGEEQKLTFGQFVEQVFIPGSPGKPKTVITRQSCLRTIQRIAPELAATKMEDVRPLDFTTLANRMQREDLPMIRHPREVIARYSNGGINKLMQFCHTVMRFAAANGIVSWSARWKNLTVAKRAKPLSPDQITLMLGQVQDRHHAPALVLAVTGVRVSELRGLTLDELPRLSWDMASQSYVVNDGGPWRMTIDHQLDDERRVLVEPKSAKGKRWIPLHRETYEIIAAHLNRYGAGGQIDGERTLVFDVPESTLTEALARAGRRARLRQPVRPHLLRHSYATWMASLGVNPKEIQRRMGHASFAITMDLYADVIDDPTATDEMREVVELLATHQQRTSTSLAPAPQMSRSVDNRRESAGL